MHNYQNIALSYLAYSRYDRAKPGMSSKTKILHFHFMNSRFVILLQGSTANLRPLHNSKTAVLLQSSVKAVVPAPRRHNYLSPFQGSTTA